MATLTRQKIRARISFGGLVVSTPDVISFHVSRQRGQPSAVFSTSLKVDASTFFSSNSIIGDNIVIEAGRDGHLKTIYTGLITKCTVNPIRADASKVMLNLTGKDVISLLQGQRITRRVKSYRDGTKAPERWVAVTQVTHKSVELVKKWPNKIIHAKVAAKLDHLPGLKEGVVYTPKLDLSDRIVDRNTIPPNTNIYAEIDNSDAR